LFCCFFLLVEKNAVVETSLSSETVQGAALAFQSVDDLHGSDSLSAGVLGVGNGITNDILQKDLEDSTGLFVDESTDSLDTTTAGQTANSGLGNSGNVISEDLAMTLGSSLSQSFSS